MLAEQHGVCVRPLAIRRIDTTTGRVEIVPVGPVIERTKPADEQTELMAARADLLTAYAECRAAGDEASCK